MKTFLLLLLCCLSAVAQPYKPNSLNTNVLGTNLVFNPATFKLAIRGAGPGLDFWNTSGGADLKRYSIVDSGNQLRFEWHSDNGGSSLLLGTFSSDGNFAPISLSLSSGTNRLTIANNQLLLDGVPVVGDSSAPITNIYATTINVTTQHFTIGKGGSLTITNALTPQQIGASKLVATEANGALTNADGVFTTRGAVLSRGASAWVEIVPSTAGYVFTDGGVGADPFWAAPAAGGLATSASQYAIVGGAASGALNWTALSNAYVTAKTATPNGAALAIGNRYTVFLLPGLYDMGASTLTLDTQFIDIVGLSSNTGQQAYGAGLTGDKGDTILKSSANVVNITVASPDITLANLCLWGTNGGGDYGMATVNQTAAFRLQNILFYGSRSMTEAVTYGGTYIDVRAWGGGYTFGWTITSGGVASGTFIRCKASGNSFGYTASGVFIDCEADGASFGNTAASGTFIRCRQVVTLGTAGGILTGTFTGNAEDCYTTVALTYSSGTVRNCNFAGTIENRGLTVINSSTGFSSSDATASAAIAATGWTNTLGKLVRVFFNGTAMTFTMKNAAGTPYYTNTVALTGSDMVILQASEAITIAGTGVEGVRKPL